MSYEALNRIDARPDRRRRVTARRVLTAVGLLALAIAAGVIAAIAYCDDSDWPLGPRSGR